MKYRTVMAGVDASRRHWGPWVPRLLIAAVVFAPGLQGAAPSSMPGMGGLFGRILAPTFNEGDVAVEGAGRTVMAPQTPVQRTVWLPGAAILTALVSTLIRSLARRSPAHSWRRPAQAPPRTRRVGRAPPR